MNRLRIVYLDGLPDAIEVTVRPDFGMVWEIIDLFGFHTSATTQLPYWAYMDGSIGVSKGTPGATAADVRVPIAACDVKNYNSLTAPLKLTHNTFAKFFVDSISAGKQLKVRGIIRETDENLL